MQPIFSRNLDIDKIAFLNWRFSASNDIKNLLNLADSYLLSSIELTKQCLEKNEDKRADILIFPILTNLNHGIELYLKCLNWILNKLMRGDEKFDKTHDIKQIYQNVEIMFKSYKGNITYEEFKEDTVELESYIDELFDKIRSTEKKHKMDFSRYTFDNQNNNHFYVDELGNIEIDLQNFVKRVETIKEKIENLTDFMYYQELLNEW